MNVLLDAETIQTRVKALAQEIERDYPGDDEIHLVCVLKGGFIFMADLVRAMSHRVSLDFIAVSSYAKSTKSSGEVRMLKDLGSPARPSHEADRQHAVGELRGELPKGTGRGPALDPA